MPCPPLRKVFSALRDQRDLELLVDTIRLTIKAAGGPPLVFKSATKSETDVGAAVRATDFQLALRELVGFTMSQPQEELAERGACATPATNAQARKLLRKRLRSLHRRVVSDGETFASLTADERHRVRKRRKRLRYFTEFVGALFSDKRAGRYIAALAPAQDALGTFNDLAVASASYTHLAPRNAKAWFAVRRLAAL